jgi:DNA-binding SARP family transcriptional activator
MGLELRILGPWQITVDGEPVRLAGERRVGVLTRLALSAGQPVAAEQLLTQVWGESTAATAAKQLQIVVSKLRGLLSPHHDDDLITTVSGGYQLNLPRERVDAHLFSLLARRARAARAQGELAAADGLFQQALGLWRGNALAGMTGSWARAESACLEEERLAVLEEHVDLRLAAGEHDAVVPVLTAHVEAHPLRERPRAQLMLAQYRAARPSKALAVYRETRRVLADELGIEPGGALRRLQQAVLRRDPALELPRYSGQFRGPTLCPSPTTLICRPGLCGNVHTICSTARADRSPAGVDRVTTRWPSGSAVTENGPAPGGTSLVSPEDCSLAVGPIASRSSVDVGDSGAPGRVTARSRPSFTR